MELIGVENSKVIYLMDIFRPSGQVYQPDLVVKIAQRYSFVRYPTLENLAKNEISFGMGKFADVQISEFNIYNDGVIASSSSNTSYIDTFVDDILDWVKTEFGIVQLLDGHPPERIYESAIIIKSDANLISALAPRTDIAGLINKFYQSDRYTGGEMELTGFLASVDRSKFTGRRKPVSFSLDRRLGIPFENNLYYSMAPLHTNDHIDVLRSFERLALLS